MGLIFLAIKHGNSGGTRSTLVSLTPGAAYNSAYVALPRFHLTRERRDPLAKFRVKTRPKASALLGPRGSKERRRSLEAEAKEG